MKKYVCKIYLKNGKKGTGFFCNISYSGKNLHVMITNSHIIDSYYVKKNEIKKVTLNNDEDDKTIKLSDNRIIYSNKE